MKFDLQSARILTPKNVELDMLSIYEPGAGYVMHNFRKSDSNKDWYLELDGTFKHCEVPYLRGMVFKITDSFTQFFVLCYSVKKVDYGDKAGKYKYLICHDVDNIEFLEHAARTDKYIKVFEPGGELPPLEETDASDRG